MTEASTSQQSTPIFTSQNLIDENLIEYMRKLVKDFLAIVRNFWFQVDFYIYFKYFC